MFREFRTIREEYDASYWRWCVVIVWRALFNPDYGVIGWSLLTVVVWVGFWLTSPISIPLIAAWMRYSSRNTIRAQYPQVDSPEEESDDDPS